MDDGPRALFFSFSPASLRDKEASEEKRGTARRQNLRTVKAVPCERGIKTYEFSSLVPRQEPIRAIRVTMGGLEPSAIGEFSRQA